VVNLIVMLEPVPAVFYSKTVILPGVSLEQVCGGGMYVGVLFGYS